MGIKIFVHQVTQQLGQHELPCNGCGARTVHRLVRQYALTSIVFLPIAGSGTVNQATCTHCNTTSSVKSFPGLPKKPFFHRFGWFFVLVLPWLVFAGYLTIEYLQDQQMKREYLEQRALRQDARQKLETIRTRVKDARKKCFGTISQALKAAYPDGYEKVKTSRPGNLSRISGSPVVSIRSPSGTSMPRPNHPLFGRQSACDIPSDKDIGAMYGQVGQETRKVLEQIEAIENKLSGLSPPPVVSATWYRCPKVCVGVVVWVDLAGQKPLGSVRVTRPMEHLGYNKDGDLLAHEVRKVVSGWKEATP